ncbi:helicase associated domain-containing protein [Kitasatospora sp. NPDC057223]|uniref:helicase associated domain-containing protein n=1 Tax=Kitasatospora sp. NPDC057223 TaxID=3346055 RepID=UPI003645A095
MVIDVVQAVSRALHQSHRPGKVTWVIIPAYLLTPDSNDTLATELATVKAEAEIEASSFRTIWCVLAAQNARVIGRITELRTKRAGEKEDVTESQPAPKESTVDWLRINARKHAAQILRTVKLRGFNPRATEWQRMHQLAAAFHTGHHHLDPTDKTRDGALISWLDRQRYLAGTGLLAPVRTNELDQLDRIWDKHAHARAWAETHGHLAIPAAEKLDGHAVGAWVGRQRKNPKLTAAQDAKLTALDAMWRIEPDWNRSYRRLLAYLGAGGTLDGPANRTRGEADPAFRPGAWLRKQDKARTDGKLTGPADRPVGRAARSPGSAAVRRSGRGLGLLVCRVDVRRVW